MGWYGCEQRRHDPHPAGRVLRHDQQTLSVQQQLVRIALERKRAEQARVRRRRSRGAGRPRPRRCARRPSSPRRARRPPAPGRWSGTDPPPRPEPRGEASGPWSESRSSAAEAARSRRPAAGRSRARGARSDARSARAQRMSETAEAGPSPRAVAACGLSPPSPPTARLGLASEIATVRTSAARLSMDRAYLGTVVCIRATGGKCGDMSGLGGIAPQERDLSRRRDRQAAVVLAVTAAISMLILFPLGLAIGLIAMAYAHRLRRARRLLGRARDRLHRAAVGDPRAHGLRRRRLPELESPHGRRARRHRRRSRESRPRSCGSRLATTAFRSRRCGTRSPRRVCTTS